MGKIGETMEFISAQATETATATLAEETIDMPVRYETNYAMLIHDIWFNHGQFDAGHAQADYFRVALQSISGQNPGDMNNDYTIAYLYETLSVDAIVNIFTLQDGFAHWHFDPPLLYAKQKAFLAVLSAGQASGLTGKVRIGYTIQKVSDDVFIDALTE